MRILSIYPGSRHIGLAISDPTGTIANPLMVLTHQSRDIDTDFIAREVIKNEVELIVIGQSLDEQNEWRRNTINLIASQNVMSTRARAVMGSDFAHRYAEGHPGERYYQRTDKIDEIQSWIKLQLKTLFNCQHMEVRPISGTIANDAVFSRYIAPGDVVMVNSTAGGGHISHHKSGSVGKYTKNIVDFPLTPDGYHLDCEQTEKLITKQLPRVLILGKSLFLFPEPVRELRKVCSDNKYALLRGKEVHMADKHGRILVVDDYKINRMQLKRSLEQHGHTVALAENGIQALEMLGGSDFDLVLLDILMPEMSGFEVLARLKSDPARRDLPVIVISSLDEMDNVIQAIKAGAEDFLPKPFDPTLLHARIDACLEKKKFRDHEIEYLRHVTRLTDAAAAVQTHTFKAEQLASTAGRSDAHTRRKPLHR